MKSKHDLHVTYENTRESIMVLMEKDLKKREAKIFRTVHFIVDTTIFCISAVIALLLTTILTTLPAINFLSTFIIIGIVTNIIFKKAGDTDQIIYEKCKKVIGNHRIELQKYNGFLLEKLQLNINEMIDMIDEEIRNRQENSITPINMPTKTFDNKINVEEIRENQTGAYTKRKF